MTDKVDYLIEASQALSVDDVGAAKAIVNRHYPFKPHDAKRKAIGKSRSLKLFRRDRFTDRYFGQRLIFPGAFLVMTKLMPDAFPSHPNWRTDTTHVAYYELWPVIDHVLPIAMGGTYDDDNLATTSAMNNSRKANFTLRQMEWSLLPIDSNHSWDGLTSWFAEMVGSNPSLLDDAYIKRWHDVV